MTTVSTISRLAVILTTMRVFRENDKAVPAEAQLILDAMRAPLSKEEITALGDYIALQDEIDAELFQQECEAAYKADKANWEADAAAEPPIDILSLMAKTRTDSTH